MSSATAPGKTRGPYARTAQRRVEIISAASAVFATAGYHGGSLRQIARDLNLSFTSLIHHFPTKEDLLVAVLEDADEGEQEQIRSDARAFGVVAAFSQLAERNLKKPETLRLLAVLAAEASTPTHPAHEWFRVRYQRVRGIVENAILADAGVGRINIVGVPADLAAEIIATWDGLQLQWLISPEINMVRLLHINLNRLLPSPDAS